MLDVEADRRQHQPGGQGDGRALPGLQRTAGWEAARGHRQRGPVATTGCDAQSWWREAPEGWDVCLLVADSLRFTTESTASQSKIPRF